MSLKIDDRDAVLVTDPTSNDETMPSTKPRNMKPVLIQDDTPVMYAALVREYDALRAAYEALLAHYQILIKK